MTSLQSAHQRFPTVLATSSLAAAGAASLRLERRTHSIFQRRVRTGWLRRCHHRRASSVMAEVMEKVPVLAVLARRYAPAPLGPAMVDNTSSWEKSECLKFLTLFWWNSITPPARGGPRGIFAAKLRKWSCWIWTGWNSSKCCRELEKIRRKCCLPTTFWAKSNFWPKLAENVNFRQFLRILQKLAENFRDWDFRVRGSRTWLGIWFSGRVKFKIF